MVMKNNLNERVEKENDMNSMLKALTEENNYTRTENGAVAYSSTLSAVLDLFAFGGAYRSRSNDDCIFLFKKAFEENPELALKCLFYLGDCRGGQGERRFFRVCFRWLVEKHTEIAEKLIEFIPEYRRWDDVLYTCLDTPLENEALAFIKKQLELDLKCKTPSLLAKWLPSENGSSAATKANGRRIRKYLGYTCKQYRKTLSELRSRINIVEKLMSSNRWQDIEFDKLPSKAGLIYKNAFARKDIIAKKYEEFIKNAATTVNANTLYPYEIVNEAIKFYHFQKVNNIDDVNRVAIEKYWNNLPDYFGGKQSNMLCVVDTSGSMEGLPINVAISLGIYAAERAGGPFKDHYISFSRNPKLIKVEGVDFIDKVKRIYNTNLCENTNLTGVFDLLLKIANRPDVKEEDLPSDIIVISDMEVDQGTESWDNGYKESWSEKTVMTEMDKVRRKWATHGHKMPRLVYWNVNSRNRNVILDLGPGVSLVSGMSPTLFTQIITGKTGYDLMMETLGLERYKKVSI